MWRWGEAFHVPQWPPETWALGTLGAAGWGLGHPRGAPAAAIVLRCLRASGSIQQSCGGTVVDRS